MDLRIDVTGDVQIDRKLLRFGDKARDARPAFNQIMDMLVDDEREQFNTQGEFASGGWSPLADVTVKHKTAKGLDSRILRATGDLYRSLATKRAKGSIRNARMQWMEFGTRVPYAQYHQHGTSRMPQRRPVEIRDQDRSGMVRILQRYLIEEFE